MRWILAVIYAAMAVARPLHENTLVVVDANGAPLEADDVVKPLEARGHSVTLKAVKDGVELFDLGRRAYDNVLVVPGKTRGLGKGLSARNILQFLADGGNFVALTTPKAAPLSIRDTAAQLGIKLCSKGVTLEDSFGTKLESGNFEVSQIVSYKEDLSLPSDSSVALIDENPLALGILSAPFTSFSKNVLEGEEAGEPFTQGNGFLVAGSQTRDNARFAWIGSAELLAGDVGAQLTEWAFQERGVLRVAGVSHHDDTGAQHHVYKISENITYCANIEEWNGSEWVKYQADDVQVEFRMLDPYYRLTLGDDLCTKFQIPDQYGMFTFDLKYTRPGLTFLNDEKTVTIRHNANDEWPRSWTITNSWVYMSSAFVITIAWLLFVGVYFG